MEGVASPKLTQLRTLHSELDLLSSMLHSTATPVDLDLDERIYQDHIHIVLDLCGNMINYLRQSLGRRPNLLDVLNQWERGGLSNEVVGAVERSTGLQSTEFTEAKSIFESIDEIKENTWTLFRVCQWKYIVMLVLMEWRRTLPEC